MKIFIYEFVTGGGMHELGENYPPHGSLLAEGSAMISALATDFSQISGVEIIALKDCRLTEFTLPKTQLVNVECRRQEQESISKIARRADHTIVIAPEFDGFLYSRCKQVIDAGGKLLGPDLQLVSLASDKTQTAEHLRSNGIRAPNALTLPAGKNPPQDFPYPAVLKPIDGAGSIDLQFLSTQDAKSFSKNMRLEEFHSGMSVSAAFIRGKNKTFNLPPCMQVLTQDGKFSYLGGELPLSQDLSKRATSLANSALATFPAGVGYLGIDLVLGRADDGSKDVVIEINPRLTTSYVGLRAACNTNLAEAMLNLALGKDAELTFNSRKIYFNANGKIDSRSI